MRITAISAGGGQAPLFALITDMLSELGDTVSKFDLTELNLPFDDGSFNEKADGLVSALTQSDGAAFVFDSAFGLPAAGLCVLLEYFRSYPNALAGKNCFTATGSKAAAEAFARSLEALGAAEAVRAVVPLDGLAEGSPAKVLAERLTEDFYRVVRQNRPVLAAERAKTVYAAPPQSPAQPAAPPPQPPAASAAREKRKPVTEERRKDVEELSGLFAKRFMQTGDTVAPAGVAAIERQGAAPRERSCEQLTQSLAHHVNPEAAAEVNAAFQFIIDGAGGFTGYIAALDGACSYERGEAARADITMLADDEAWRDVLRGKTSAKKAFMVGRLKVRGNFMLLTKFDEMFDFEAL